MNGSQRKDRLSHLERVPWIALGVALAAVFLAARMVASLVLE